MILMALALGISVAATTSPALAETGDDKVNRGVEQVLAQSDRDTPQVGVGVVAGSDEERPAVQQWRYDNREGR